MKILAIDFDSLFRRNWEAEAGQDGGNAYRRTVEEIQRRRDGWDRVVLAADSGPSFRKAKATDYKEGRTNPGAAYFDQRRRTLARLAADACIVIDPQVILDEELERLVGAGPYERSDQRVDVRNGRYDRHVVTTAGEVAVRVGRTRAGGAATAPLGRYARRQAEVDDAVTEAYVRGVSTRDMAGVTEALVFTLVDPMDLSWFGAAPVQLSREAIYTLGFMAFWVLISLASAMTLLLARLPAEAAPGRPGPGRPVRAMRRASSWSAGGPLVWLLWWWWW